MNSNNNLFFKDNSLKIKQEPFAEIVEGCLDNFLAQSWKWDKFPDFGSLVEVVGKEITTVGCVCHVQTGSLDPVRYPFPYQKTEEELLQEQPQIFEFLKTIFKVQILGYKNSLINDDKFFYLLPSKLCKIHSFVQNVSSDTSNTFFQSADFLNILFSFANQIPNLDELLLAIIRNLAQSQSLSEKFLDDFSQQFSLHTGNDYRRLKLFLRRVEALV